MTFEVSVVELPANYTIKLDDGRTDNTSITQGITSHDSGENQTFKTVDFPDSARLHGRYEVGPHESNRTTIEKFPRNFAVVVVVSQNQNEIVAYVTANCADLDLAALRVTWQSHGVSTTHSCVS